VEILQRFLHQRVDQGEGVLHGQPLFTRLFRRKTVADNKFIVTVALFYLINGVNDGERKAQTFLHAAAPVIFTAVTLGRDKLLDQVIIRTVDLNAIKTRLNSKMGGTGKRSNQPVDFSFTQGTRA